VQLFNSLRKPHRVGRANSPVSWAIGVIRSLHLRMEIGNRESDVRRAQGSPYSRAMATGIFCVENWSERLTEHNSVRPLLEFMAPRGHGVRYVHRHVDSGDQLNYYLDRWLWLSRYQLGYFAFHGSPGQVYVGNEPLTLRRLLMWSHEESPRTEDLTDEEIAAREAQRGHDWIALAGKVLYLGSCSTPAVRDRYELDDLRAKTGDVAICGYTRDVFWYEAAAFDLLLLSELAYALELKRPKPGVERALNRLRVRHRRLVMNLGFISSPPVR
jgi:hypothetical protein